MATVLVDGNNVGMAAYATADNLTDPQGRPVGAIFGMIRMLRPMLARVEKVYGDEPIKLIVAWDSKPSWRSEILPSYKSSRTEKRDAHTEQFFENYVDQLPRLRAMLPLLGIGQLTVKGFEADDIAGWMTGAYADKNWVLMTNDRDWLQLVRPNVWVWQPKNELFVTPDNFFEETGCDDTEMFVKVKALAGDKGDDVPGCKGIGDKTAIKYFKGQLPAKSKKLADIEAWMNAEDGFARSKLLVDLRDIRCSDHSADVLTMLPGAFDYKGFYEACRDYAFESILTEYNDWVEPFQKAA